MLSQKQFLDYTRVKENCDWMPRTPPAETFCEVELKIEILFACMEGNLSTANADPVGNAMHLNVF